MLYNYLSSCEVYIRQVSYQYFLYHFFGGFLIVESNKSISYSVRVSSRSRETRGDLGRNCPDANDSKVFPFVPAKRLWWEKGCVPSFLAAWQGYKTTIYSWAFLLLFWISVQYQQRWARMRDLSIISRASRKQHATLTVHRAPRRQDDIQEG